MIQCIGPMIDDVSLVRLLIYMSNTRVLLYVCLARYTFFFHYLFFIAFNNVLLGAVAVVHSRSIRLRIQQYVKRFTFVIMNHERHLFICTFIVFMLIENICINDKRRANHRFSRQPSHFTRLKNPQEINSNAENNLKYH